MRTRPILLALPIIFSCAAPTEGSPDEGTDDRSPSSPSTTSSVDLSAWDVPLLVAAPERPGDSLQVIWNEEFGHLEVEAGEHFSLIITEGAGDMARLKADLERDLLRSHDVLREEPGLLIYRSTFPDDTDLVFVHAYQELQVGDRSFVIETGPQGRFNEADVDVMVRAVIPKEGA